MTDTSFGADPHAPEPEASPTRAPPPKPQGESLWARALFMLLFAIVADVLLWIFLACCLLQLIVYLVSEKPNEELREFMRKLLAYIGVTLAYLAFLQDEKPFPFSPFPSSTSAAPPL